MYNFKCSISANQKDPQTQLEPLHIWKESTETRDLKWVLPTALVSGQFWRGCTLALCFDFRLSANGAHQWCWSVTLLAQDLQGPVVQFYTGGEHDVSLPGRVESYMDTSIVGNPFLFLVSLRIGSLNSLVFPVWHCCWQSQTKPEENAPRFLLMSSS